MAEFVSILCPENFLDEASSIVCAGEDPNFPAEALRRRNGDSSSRTTNATTGATQWTITWANPVLVDTIALVGFNASATATFSVTGGITSGAQPFWKNSRAPRKLQPITSFKAAAPASITSLTISVNDTGNADGHLKLKRIFVGLDMNLTTNMNYGWAIGVIDSSTAATTPGGQEYRTAGNVRRMLSAKFEWATEDEAMEEWLEMEAYQSLCRDVLFIPRVGGDFVNHQSMYARFQNLQPHRQSQRTNLWECTLNLKEIL